MKLIVLVSMLMSLLSCSFAPDRLHKLDVSLIGYEKTLRWGHVDAVVGYMKSESSTDDQRVERLSHINIGGYQVLNRVITDDGYRAELTVAIDYIDNDSMRVRKLIDRQVWQLDEESDRWFLTSKLPYFK